MRIRLALFLSVLFLAFQNCAKVASDDGSSSGSQSSSAAAATETVCPLAPTVMRTPRAIDDVTALINALPKPLTLECFLQNLTGPLDVVATDSVASAQPSGGPQSPRLFILNNPLILSVVPAGSARNLLEMSQIYAPGGVTVKAELTFPIVANVAAAAPYDEIRAVGSSTGTSCRVCHSGEYQATGFGGTAFASLGVRPNAAKAVDVSTMVSYALKCDSAADAYRCGVLRAVFVRGAAEQGFFPF